MTKKSPQKISAEQRTCYWCRKVRPWDRLVEDWHVEYADPPEQVYHMQCRDEKECC